MINLENILILKKGGIHIKKENIGSFTRYCGGNVTQECIERGKNSPSAAIRKKSVFADNARHWKHENGGILKAQGGLKIIKRVLSHIDDVPKSKLTYWERMGIPKGERNWDTQMGRLRKGTTLNERELAEQLRAMHFAEKAKDNKLTWKNSNANWDYAPVTKPRWINLPQDSPFSYSDIVAENTPVQFFHGTRERFNIFDYNKAYGADPHFFFSTDKNYIKEFFKRYYSNNNPIIKRYYLYSQNPVHITRTRAKWDLNGRNDVTEPHVLSAYDVQENIKWHPDADSFYGPDLGKIDMEDVDRHWEDGFISLFPENYPTEIAIPHNTRIKLTSPFVYDDNGHFIKLSKRDDFTNPDTRYNKGGKL